ncbi:MAG: putative sulfate exporter family transporter [Pseudomonadota bacterium]
MPTSLFSGAGACLGLALLVWVGNPALALLVGSAIALIGQVRWIPGAGGYSKLTLQTAIVLLGLKINISDMGAITAQYTVPVAIYVIGVLGVGLGLAWLLRVQRDAGVLLAGGTAICGGTTIASLAPILGAPSAITGACLAIVFALNALALLIFPYIGTWLQMSQAQFGIWVALAIHDTSSVVATANLYGEQAAAIATTVKLGRTLWLIPLVVFVSVLTRAASAQVRIPGFIVLFIFASVAGSLLDLPVIVREGVEFAVSALLVGALFLIGLDFTREDVRAIKPRLLLQALVLWVLAVVATLYATRYFIAA